MDAASGYRESRLFANTGHPKPLPKWTASETTCTSKVQKQLMPMTARELGVNPHIPEQNIEGGVRYFSQLLRMFGGLELALIAYNGGPGYAQRYARGQVALYGETRDYVKKVLARLQALR